MSQMHKIIIFVFLIVLNVAVAQANDHWSVQGVSPYQQLSRTLFYARLVSTKGISAEELLEGNVAFQLDVVVSEKSLSARRWRSLFMEGVMINHQLDQLAGYTADLNQMMRKFTLRLKKGDLLEVQYHPVNGSRVRLNGIDFGAFEQAQFSLLLLRGWVGDVPLSTGFKKALFSDRSAAIQAEMDSFALTPERRAATSQALRDKAANTSVVSGAVTSTATTKLSKSTAPTPKVLPPITVAVTQPERLSAPVAVSRTPVQPVAKAPASTSNNSSSASIKTAAKKPAQKVEESKPSSVKPLQESVPVVSSVQTEMNVQKPEDTTDVVDVMNEEVLRLRQEYYRKLVASVSAKKAIPFKAFQRGWKGEVRIEVTINRIGEVQNVTVLEPSRYDLFNEQAVIAAETAQPLPEMPTKIQGEQFTFSVPLSYSFIK